jgi:hypothetical protein
MGISPADPDDVGMSHLTQIPDDSYRPGYPIDRRRGQRVARLNKGSLGDFECLAARVVARLTGERVILEDDGSRDGMNDIRIEYADRRPGYVEVWTDIERGYAKTYSRLMSRGSQLPQELSVAALRREWFVTVSGRSDLRRLEAEIQSLAPLEASGETFQGWRDTRRSSRLTRMWRWTAPGSPQAQFLESHSVFGVKGTETFDPAQAKSRTRGYGHRVDRAFEPVR